MRNGLLSMRRRGRSLRVAAMVAVALAVTASPARAQLEVENLEVFLRPDAAGRVGTVTMRNVGSDAITLSSEFMDWERDLAGTNQYLPLGTTRGSCRNTLSVFPAALRIEPGQTQQVRVVLADDAPATVCWSLLTLSQAPQMVSDSGAVQLQVVVKTGIKIYVEPAGARRDVSIDSAYVLADTTLQIDQRTVRGPVAVVYVGSTGELQARPGGVLELRRLDNSVAGTTAIEAFPVLPGATRRLVIPMPRVAPGRYVGLVLLDAGGPERVAAQLDVEIGPQER